MINSRFTVAVHLLALLSAKRHYRPDMPLTSEIAAESVNTNPVVVRRILGTLREAGLVSSQPGPAGGWFLERDPEQIRLDQVYSAVEDEPLFSMHHRPPNARCMIGGHIQTTLNGIFAEAEVAMKEKLAQKTVADVVETVLALRKECAG